MKITKPIKERLNAHREMVEKLKALKDELDFARSQFGAVKSPNLSGMPGGGGYKGISETEVVVIRAIELEERSESSRRKSTPTGRGWSQSSNS